MSSEIFRLDGKRALVCGASQGIGRAIAVEFAKSGAFVIALARSRDKLLDLQQTVGSKHLQILVCDLDQLSDVETKIQTLLSEIGDIQILVNNSAGPAPGPLLDAPPESFVLAFQRHILAAQLLTRLFLPGMVKSNYGRILNIISTSVREPIVNLGVSNTIRGAMASWAKTMASELPPGVTINNILPGYTATPRLESLKKATADKRGLSLQDVEREWIQVIPEKRIAKPEEVAWPALFLASPAASYIRGVSLAVDGGRMKGI